jgi:hypothetical protein
MHKDELCPDDRGAWEKGPLPAGWLRTVEAKFAWQVGENVSDNTFYYNEVQEVGQTM